jgi:hypothetical protein
VLLFRYLDVALVVMATPIMLLIGVPATGYLVAAGAWVVLRVVGVGVERYTAQADPRVMISVRLGYLMGRLFLLALAVILVRRGQSQDEGLTALLVIVFAFTVQLAISFATRPRRQ